MDKTVVSAVLLFGTVVSVGMASSASKQDKPVIPADLYYEFKAVPAGDNAIINWRRAAEVEAALSDKESQSLKFCWTPGAKKPSSGELNDLSGWLHRDRDALKLFNDSLKKPKAQWPERDPQNLQPELAGFSRLIKARLFEADQLADLGKFEQSIKILEENLKLAQLGVEGDAQFLHYLVSSRARTITQDAVLRLACRKQVPVSLLKTLLNSLHELDSETNVYGRVLRVEFANDYNDSLDLKKLADDWSRMSGTNAALFLSFYPDDLQKAFRVLLDPSLVPFHPKPYDANEEIEKSIRHYRIYRTNSLTPWTERDNEVELEHADDHTNLLHDIAPLMELVKDESLPLNRQAAQKARPAYLQIENPIGRIFDTSVIHFIVSDLKVCQIRTEREATRACLALIIFERQKGRLPATLSDLVQQKILDSVPIDPFCGEPLHYSREKREVWSISDNGVDDNGESGKLRWFEKDAVWQIPELN